MKLCDKYEFCLFEEGHEGRCMTVSKIEDDMGRNPIFTVQMSSPEDHDGKMQHIAVMPTVRELLIGAIRGPGPERVLLQHDAAKIIELSYLDRRAKELFR